MGIGEAVLLDFGHWKNRAARAREIIFGSEWGCVWFEGQRERLKFLRGAQLRRLRRIGFAQEGVV
jgi:hypothetical protein